MQGGYETYPSRPAPAPAAIGQALLQRRPMDEAEPVEESPMMEAQETPMSPAPHASPAAAVHSGQLSSAVPDSGLLASIGGALTRIDNGLMPPTSPTRPLNAEARFRQLLALGMSPAEAHLMTTTGGA